MTSNAVAIQTSMADQMEYARIVTSGGGQSILPDAYRGNPANVLIAVGLGQSMGLSPAESLYRISVIKGKPSAGAELIAANVRKAGHKLRVRGDDSTCTATIVRADDPDYEFTVTRDMAWAQRMGLASNDNYRKQPGTMLQWRAITACARLACPEALYGVAYTPDEIAEITPVGGQDAPTERSAMSRLRARMDAATHPEQTGPLMNSDVQDADVIDEPVETGEVITEPQRKTLFAAFHDAGFTTDARTNDGRKARLNYLSTLLDRPVDSTMTLTAAEASRAIDALRQDAQETEVQP